MLIDYKKVNIYQDERLILKDVDFQAETGEFIYLIGRVGSGKRSLLKTIYGELDIDNVELVADITHYCIKGLEVPFIYGRLGHGLTEESSRPLVAKVVYGALGKGIIK